MSGIFALMIRTLRQDSRNWQSGAIRASLLIILLMTLALSQSASRSAGGLTFVWWVLWFSYAAVSIVSAFWFASSIAEEREQRSLGLLRMTNLNGLAILLGKWCPRMALVVMLIGLQFPLALLGVTLGGVTPSQLLAAYVALLAYSLMISSIGMLATVVCNASDRAAGLVVVCWIGLSLSPWFGSMIVSRMMTYQWISNATGERVFIQLDRIKDFSLWHRMNSILSTQPDVRLWDVQVWGNILFAVLVFAVAWIAFEYLTIYRLEIPAKAAPKDRLSNRLFRSKRAARDNRKGTRFLVGRTWSRALAWREFHFNAGGWWTVLTKCAVYGCVPWIVLAIAAATDSPFQNSQRAVGISWMIVGGLAFMGESLFYSNRVFGTDAFEKTLTSVTLLPMSVVQLAWSKVSGFIPALIPSMSFFAIGCLCTRTDSAEFFDKIMAWQGLFSLSFFLLFLHVTAYFSIHTRGGLLVAFALSIGLSLVMTFVGQVMTPVRAPGADQALPFLIFIGAMWVGIVGLQFLIGRSLRHKAAS